MNLAPILLFVYNRPHHTMRTIEALKKNTLSKESQLIVYSDGPKDNRDIQKVQDTRKYLQTVEGFKSIRIIERDKNFGLADNIVDGVTIVINEHEKVIVLEDDLLTSPNFLEFMNEGLAKYANSENVYSITGYSFTDDDNSIDSTYFLNLTSSWGWGTWKNRWSVFNRNPSSLSNIISNDLIKNKFDLDDSSNFSHLAELQLKGRINSWAIFWYAAVFNKNGLTLFPQKKLVKNIGFDGSGVHCGEVSGNDNLVSFNFKLTDELKENISAKKVVRKVLKSLKGSLLKRVISKIKKEVRPYISLKKRAYFSTLFKKVRLLFLKKKIGKGTYLDKSVHVLGWENISIGENSVIGQDSWLNVNGRESGVYHIEIGNNCYIGQRNLLSSGLKLKMNDFLMTGNDCKFLGSDHLFNNPELPYISTGATFDTSINIGTNVWFGSNSIVLGGVTVGYGSIIGAGSVVTKDIPPFSIAVGNPCKVIKRFDFNSSAWVRIEKFDETMNQLIPLENEYLIKLKSNATEIVMPVNAATHRFGDLP
jgi:acetyltransferase-like isoleucine patch superfamily enzyme